MEKVPPPQHTFFADKGIHYKQPKYRFMHDYHDHILFIYDYFNNILLTEFWDWIDIEFSWKCLIFSRNLT